MITIYTIISGGSVMNEKNTTINIYQEAESTDHYFYLHNGTPVKSLAELIDQLVNMDQGLFNHHVNKKNNDFANWIRDVFGEKELARRITLTRSPKGMLKSITKYLE
jgi:hypothetical protein